MKVEFFGKWVFEVFCYPPHCNGEQKTGNLKKDKASKTRAAVIPGGIMPEPSRMAKKSGVIGDSSLDEALDSECLRKNRKRNPPSEPLKYSDLSRTNYGCLLTGFGTALASRHCLMVLAKAGMP